MNVLSLFDGMSCGQIALNRAGIKYDNYFASEIDKYAIQVTMANYPNTIQLGSVIDIDGYKLPKIDILIGGSPCQSFSFAGKRKGMSTKCEIEILTLDQYLTLKSEGYEFEGQSYLFWEYIRILNEVKPKYFLLENVLMSEKWERIISNTIGLNPIEINSALVSAQNRRRLYWTNIGLEPGGLFGYLESIIKQPKDKGILLKDVLEKDVLDKYYLSDKMLEYFSTRAANFNGGKVNIRDEYGKATAILSSSSSIDISDNFIKVDTNLKKSPNQEKANCFTAGGHSGGLHSDMTLIGCVKFGRTDEAKEIRKESMRNGKDYTPFQAKEITGIDYEKMNTITTVGSKDNLVIHQRGRGFNKGGIFEDKSPPLTSNSWEHNNTLKIRRLTPLECERLQTVSDNYTNHVSDTQRYRMLGNGWTVDVVAHIFSYLK